MSPLSRCFWLTALRSTLRNSRLWIASAMLTLPSRSTISSLSLSGSISAPCAPSVPRNSRRPVTRFSVRSISWLVMSWNCMLVMAALTWPPTWPCSASSSARSSGVGEPPASSRLMVCCCAPTASWIAMKLTDSFSIASSSSRPVWIRSVSTSVRCFLPWSETPDNRRFTWEPSIFFLVIKVSFSSNLAGAARDPLLLLPLRCPIRPAPYCLILPALGACFGRLLCRRGRRVGRRAVVHVELGAVAHHVLLGLLVHDDDADAAVDRVERVLLVEVGGRGQAHHAQYFILIHAAGDQLAARGVGAVGRQFPVAVAGVAQIRRRIGVAGQADFIRHIVQHRADLVQDVARVRLQLGLGQREHRAVLLVDDLDAQAFAGEVQQQLVLVLLEQRIGVDLGFDLFLQRLQTHGFFVFEGLLGGRQVIGPLDARVFGIAHLAVAPGQVLAAAGDHRRAVAAAGAALHGHLQRRLEVFGDAVQVALGGRAEQPHQKEEGHRGRDEVGVSDFPRAAMAAAADLLDAFDDNRPQALFSHDDSLLNALLRKS